ncbi:MAG: hypothetical protein AAGF98_05135 [Cyanobacteria bacterium P01_H01_bin.153]
MIILTRAAIAKARSPQYAQQQLRFTRRLTLAVLQSDDTEYAPASNISVALRW